MRRVTNFLGVLAVAGLVCALALPAGEAYAGKKSTTNGQMGGSTCGSNGKDQNGNPCNCPPHYALIAYGTGPAVDDLTESYTGPDAVHDYQGCYDPGTPDLLKPNDTPELACPSDLEGCGCILAGGDNPGGTDVSLVSNSDFGLWTLKQVEINFAYLTFPTDDYTGDQNGSGPGTNGGRCYGGAGFAILENNGGGNNLIPIGTTVYLLLQGMVCDAMPVTTVSPPTNQRFSFNGTFVLIRLIPRLLFWRLLAHGPERVTSCLPFRT